jgi:hypothetical protein
MCRRNYRISSVLPAANEDTPQIPLRPQCPLWLNSNVPRKKKLKKFTAAKAVKSMSRAALGTPPPVQREESTKRRKTPKHKPTLGRLLSEGD